MMQIGTLGEQPSWGAQRYGAAQPTTQTGATTQVGTPKDAKETDKTAKGEKKERFDVNDCQTCKNRRYQDGSDDPGVSFKSPTKVDPRAAAGAVAAHEGEHVMREQAKAKQEGRRVVSQTVTYSTAVCSECNRPYVSGGTTRTVTKGENKKDFSQNNPRAQRTLDLKI